MPKNKLSRDERGARLRDEVKSQSENSDRFAKIRKAASLFSDLNCEWFVCGGWAIDLFLKRVTREHKDIDIAIARRDQFVMRDYLRRRGWTLEKAVDGTLIDWNDGERLESPIHGVWCSNKECDPNFVEILLNEIDDDCFRFRRDESVTLPRGRMSFKSSSGLPVLAPELVLLYKSNSAEENDADFQNTVESLADESRVWLKAALDKLFARHRWTERL